MAKEKTREERLFSAAVLRRSFELQGAEHAEGFKFVYQGVLRDLGLEKLHSRKLRSFAEVAFQ